MITVTRQDVTPPSRDILYGQSPNSDFIEGANVEESQLEGDQTFRKKLYLPDDGSGASAIEIAGIRCSHPHLAVSFLVENQGLVTIQFTPAEIVDFAGMLIKLVAYNQALQRVRRDHTPVGNRDAEMYAKAKGGFDKYPTVEDDE